MKKTLFHPTAKGIINAIASKSEVHRLLICASLSDKKTEIVCENTNEDINATVNCLVGLGADISYKNGVFSVTPIKESNQDPVLHCNESGSTLRFLLPITAFYGKNGTFITNGRLASRPLSPLKEELQKAGTEIITKGNEISVSGKCDQTEFSIPGNISSQFISGLLFMLSQTGGKVTVTSSIESRPYIEMTIAALKKFGCEIDFCDNILTVPKTCPLRSPQTIKSTGDWSNAAFFIAAGVIGDRAISVSGLDINSHQGDKKIIDILRNFGAEIKIDNDVVTAYPSALSAYSFDASDIPDLVPILSTVAANSSGITRITGCQRLRLKESDRIEAVTNMITSLGGKISTDNDDIIIEGYPLSGGTVNSHNDHRIAMSAAIAAFSCENEVIIENAQAVNKSYPSFFREIR